MQDHVSRLLGLDGFVVSGVEEARDQLDLQVELIAGALVTCPYCQGVEVRIKERPRVRVRDLSLAGRVTHLVWRKRRYGCQECGRSFTERHEQLPSRQRVSGRFRRHLIERVIGGAAHAEVARDERTTRYQVARAFTERAGQLPLETERLSRRLSLDEAHHRRGRELATVVSDLDRRCVIEVLDGCTRRVIERWLSALPADVRAAIEVVSIDPSEAYRRAIQAALPDARIVADRFHLVRGANTALDAIRRERQREARAKRPRGTRRSGQHVSWRPELYRARHRLLKARERLSDRERHRLSQLFERDPIIAEAWGLKEAFRNMYLAPDRQQAEQRLDRFLDAVDQAALPAFDAFAKGIRQWRAELLAYFDEPTTNGYAEGVINKVKLIKRRAYGLPTFAGFRARVLLACT
ncbi:MAG: ISL3 family transposase [Solirubrobacterales bacterium]|nr:ISL3 family transposase [Solirubrobacterales bacterium]